MIGILNNWVTLLLRNYNKTEAYAEKLFRSVTGKVLLQWWVRSGMHINLSIKNMSFPRSQWSDPHVRTPRKLRGKNRETELGIGMGKNGNGNGNVEAATGGTWCSWTKSLCVAVPQKPKSETCKHEVSTFSSNITSSNSYQAHSPTT